MFIVVGNQILQFFINILSEKIGFKTKTWEVYWHGRIIILVKFVNSAIMILLMGARLDFVPVIGRIFNGTNRDFTYDWFRLIGSIFVTTTMLFSIQGFTGLITHYVV